MRPIAPSCLYKHRGVLWGKLRTLALSIDTWTQNTSLVIFPYLVTELLQKMVQEVSTIGNLATILFMQIRRSKTQNFAWEPDLSDSAYTNYAKKSGSQLFPKTAPCFLCRVFFQKSH